MKKKILFFAPVPNFKGGAERSLFDLMRNPSVEPILVTPGPGPLADAARREGIRVEALEMGSVSAIRRPITPGSVATASADWYAAARQLARFSRENDIDIVHSNGMKAHCIAGLARRLGGKPTVFHVRDIAVSSSERMIWRMLARGADHTVVVSRACWPGSEMPANVSVVHNGVEPVTEPWVGTGHATNGAAITLGFCGRIHPFKGLDAQLDWMAFARDNGVDANLVVRGEAADEDRPYLAAIQQKVADFGLSDRVRFEGRVEGLEAVYAGLDAVVVPSTVPDPLPRSVMEAMSLGFPVIGYPAGGIPDMIDDKQNGWLASNGQEFLSALREIVRGGAGVDQIRQNARKKINEGFSIKIMYEKLDGIYGRIARRGYAA